MSSTNDDAIKAFLPARSGRPVDHPLNSRDRAIGLAAATMGVGMLGESDRARLLELQQDPSKATRSATPAKGAAQKKQTVKDYVAAMPEKLREAVYNELIETGDFLPASGASTDEFDYGFVDDDEDPWAE